MSFFFHRSPWLLKQGFSVPWISPSRLDWLASESPGILCLPLARMRIENTDHHTQHRIHEFRGFKGSSYGIEDIPDLCICCFKFYV